ncbi:hypothetical protein FRC00_013298 [Tulasnella sp. 408]|nr:hypothetical protein FRC00_013298 [Tulasnella sp. 408]
MDPIFHSKAEELRDRWIGLLAPTPDAEGYTQLDINHWVSRATFDAFALAGFSYSLNVIQNEDHPLYLAYKKMFDMAINKGQTLMGFLEIYMPWLTYLPTEVNRQVNASKKIILDAGNELIREKRQALLKGLDEEKGPGNGGRDLLSLLIKSNLEETSPKQRLSDAELLAQIHSFLFVGSDSVSLSILWTLYELSHNIPLQTRVRDEILAARQASPGQTANDAAALPLLDAVVRECLRLTPPLQSTLRSAARDDIIPTEDGNGIKIRAGQLIHLPFEGMNIAKEIWGQDAWEFKPDRWFNLPETAKRTPGLVSNLMTFSIGPHSCPGVHFAIMEMKAFLAELISSFEFAPVPKKRILKGNVMVTRPFVAGEWDKGTQMPMLIRPYSPQPSTEA